jgi:tripartite-type tricarboxylate transporter receptor subunit TctC
VRIHRRFTLPLIVLLVIAVIPGERLAVSATHVPTLHELALIGSSIDVSAAAGAIAPAGVAKSLRAKVAEIRKAVESRVTRARAGSRMRSSASSTSCADSGSRHP